MRDRSMLSSVASSATILADISDVDPLGGVGREATLKEAALGIDACRPVGGGLGRPLPYTTTKPSRSARRFE
jgi:hypothetical protein